MTEEAAGSFKTSIAKGMSLRKQTHNTTIEAKILSKFGKNIFFAYSTKPISKYPTVTIFVRLEITSGFDALSPIKPPAIKNAKMARGFILRYFILASKNKIIKSRVLQHLMMKHGYFYCVLSTRTVKLAYVICKTLSR